MYRKKEGRWEATQYFTKKGIYSTIELASRTIPHPPYTQEKKEEKMVVQNCLNLIPVFDTSFSFSQADQLGMNTKGQ